MLLEVKQECTLFTGNIKTFDQSKRILITTFSKGSTGLDFPKLDCLIIASDLKDGLIQLVGRIFRRQDVKPIIFDLTEQFFPLQRHWLARKEIYKELGAEMSNFQKDYKNFHDEYMNIKRCYYYS